MSKMKKRVPMFLFVLAMMVAMALPTFAAFVNTGANGYYLFRAPHNNRLYLNLYGNTSALQSRRLTLYETSQWGNDQLFSCYRVSNGQITNYYFGQMQNSKLYSINKADISYNGGYVAFLWPINISPNELNNDSLFVFEGDKLKLANKNLRLAFTKEEDGGYVFFNQNGNDWNREFIGG